MKSVIFYIFFLTAILSCDKKNGEEAVAPGPCTKTGSADVPVKVGDKAYGGVVFYVEANGIHGMVMPKPELLSGYSASWWPRLAPYLTPGKFDLPTETAIGSGQANTKKLLGTSTTPYIAGICDDLKIDDCYDDWYLPSRDELLEIYKNLGKLPGVDRSKTYFSSNVVDKANAGILIVNVAVSFSTGTVGEVYLTDPQLYTRFEQPFWFIPVRSF